MHRKGTLRRFPTPSLFRSVILLEQTEELLSLLFLLREQRGALVGHRVDRLLRPDPQGADGVDERKRAGEGDTHDLETVKRQQVSAEDVQEDIQQSDQVACETRTGRWRVLSGILLETAQAHLQEDRMEQIVLLVILETGDHEGESICERDQHCGRN